MTHKYLLSDAVSFNFVHCEKKRGFYFFYKRLFDIFFSLLVLIFLAPLFLIIYIAIRCSSSGNPIYSQKRFGQGGKIFTCYKFRTMYLDAETRLEKMLSLNFELKAEWEENQKLKDDPRIFSFGHILRKFSLDEFPQFWNVLKGDLSVVGPRPYMLSQGRELATRAEKILSIRPGITGLWQTSGRSRTTFKERLQLDAAYVDCQSFGFDLKLIAKTILQMLFSKDAC